MELAGPNSPVYILKKGRLVKLTRAKFEELADKAESLSFFAGRQLQPEDLA